MGRPKLDRTMLQVRVSIDTPDKLKSMALKLGFQWGANGNTGQFLDAIAQIPVEKLEELIDDSSS